MSKIIEGYVTDEFPSGAYINILTNGFEKKRGFIPSEEIPPPFAGEKKLYVGDYVKAAVIGSYKPSFRDEEHLRLSISKLIRDIRNENIPHPLKGEKLSSSSSLERLDKPIDDPSKKWMKSLRFVPKKIESILLVDDMPELAKKTLNLVNDLGYHVEWEKNSDLCFDRIVKGAFDLVLMDFTLGKSTNGLDEAKEILSRLTNLSPRMVVFTRGDPYFLIQKADELGIQTNNMDDVNYSLLTQLSGIYYGSLDEKSLPKLIGLVEEGYFVSNLYEEGDEERASEEWMKRIKVSLDIGVPLKKRIHIYLEKLKEKFKTQFVAVFRFDHVTKEVTMIDDINVDHGEYLKSKKDLRYSPIRDVIENRRIKYLYDLETWQMIGTFKHLLSLFGNYIKNFLGIPLIATGPTDHGLFIVNFERSDSMEKLLDFLSNEALMIATIIERNRYQEIIESEQKFSLLGKIRSTFVHELRSATEILFYELDIFRKGQNKEVGNDELLKQFAEIIPKILERKDKIDDIFEMFKIFSRDTIRPCWLNEFLSYIVEHLLWDEVQKRDLKISYDFAKNIPKTKLNMGRLQQVIMNLVLNAFDHMGYSPSEEIFLSTSFNYKSKDRPIEIRVTDTAYGIHRKDFDKIFEPFYTTKPGGTGLGLFISKALVGSIGGQLEVENSWPYFGSTFIIRLPYISGEDKE